MLRFPLAWRRYFIQSNKCILCTVFYYHFSLVFYGWPTISKLGYSSWQFCDIDLLFIAWRVFLLNLNFFSLSSSNFEILVLSSRIEKVFLSRHLKHGSKSCFETKIAHIVYNIYSSLNGSVNLSRKFFDNNWNQILVAMTNLTVCKLIQKIYCDEIWIQFPFHECWQWPSIRSITRALSPYPPFSLMFTPSLK